MFISTNNVTHTKCRVSPLRIPSCASSLPAASPPLTFSSIPRTRLVITTLMSTPDPPTLSPREDLTLRFLAQNEAPCPACGYNVHKATLPRCPECGRALTLHLATPDAKPPAPWILLMITTSLAAGMGAFILAVTLGERMPRDLRWRIVLFYFMCTIPLPLPAFFLRRPMNAYPNFAWCLSLLFTVVNFFMLLLFIWNILYR